MKKIINKNTIIFILTFIIGIIITFPSLIPSFFLDGYCSNEIGLIEYSKNFLVSGRFLTAASYYLLGLLKISPNVISTISIVLSNIFLSLSVYLIYKNITKYTNNKINIKILVFISSFLICYNPFMIENLLFEESYAMTLSFMLCIIAANTLISDSGKKTLKTFLLLFIACFLYQSTLSIFIPYAFVLITLKTKEYNIINNIKINFKTYFLGCLCYGISLVLAYILLKATLTIFNITSYKMGELNILENIKSIIRFIYEGFLSFYNYINPYLIYAVIGFIFIIVISLMITNIKKYWSRVIFLIVLMVMSVVLAYIPNLAMNSLENYAEARMLPSFGALIGLMLMMGIIFAKQEEKVNDFIITILCMIGATLMLNVSYIYFNNSFDGLKRYENDVKYINQIKREIKNYEHKSNQQIKKIYFYSNKPRHYKLNNKTLYNLTFYATEWGFECAVGSFINKDIIVSNLSEKEYQEIINNQNNKNQNYIFDENKMYIFIE